MEAIEYKGQRVITTEMLAQAYETETDSIRHNFGRNKERFIEGKHFFSLSGEDLRKFKRDMTGSPVVISTNVSLLYLWTERGANRHSKILDTDKAWEQFENLEETYFRVKETGIYAMPLPELIRYLNSVASYLRVQRAIMRDTGCTAHEIALMDKMTCDACNIPVPECLTAPKIFEQITFNSKPLIERTAKDAKK